MRGGRLDALVDRLVSARTLKGRLGVDPAAWRRIVDETRVAPFFVRGPALEGHPVRIVPPGVTVLEAGRGRREHTDFGTVFDNPAMAALMKSCGVGASAVAAAESLRVVEHLIEPGQSVTVFGTPRAAPGGDVGYRACARVPQLYALPAGYLWIGRWSTER